MRAGLDEQPARPVVDRRRVPYEVWVRPHWGWFRRSILSGAFRRFHEPPDAEPHVRWCFYGPYRPANSNENEREQPYDGDRD